MKSKTLQTLVILLSALVVLGALTYANYRLATASPGGIDFLTHWVGTRALFHGVSPYSQGVAVQAQTAFYGRPARTGENEFLDPYLIYMEVVIAPFALIADYTLARAAWMTFLELATIAIFGMALNLANWKPRAGTLIFFFLYCVFGYHSLRPIINGNVTTVITLLIIAAVFAIKYDREELAAVLLAFATAKPNVTFLPALLVVFWMFSLKRWRFLAWFSGTLVVLVAGGMLIIPDWPLQNLRNILHYGSYNPPTTIAAALEAFFPGFGRGIGIGIYAIIAVILVIEWKRVFRADFGVFVWVCALTLLANQWLGISTDPGNFIVLTLPLVLVLKALDELPHGTVWVNLALAGLLIGLWAIFLLTVDRAHSNLQSPIMFFPLPIFIMAGLYFAYRRPAAGAIGDNQR